MDTGTFTRGTITTSDRDSGIKAPEKRSKLYYQKPANDNPLTQMIMTSKGTPTSQTKVEWFMQRYNPLAGDVDDVYTDIDMGSAYASGQAADTNVFLKVDENDAKQMIENSEIAVASLSTDSDGNTIIVTEKLLDVRGVQIIGDSSVIACRLRETDAVDNTLSGTTLKWRLVSDSHPELSGLPDEVYEEPTTEYNYAAIFMEALSMSNVEMIESQDEYISQKLYARKMMQTRARLDKKIERSLLWGQRALGTGRNGKRRWHMGGILEFIPSGNKFNYYSDTDFSGKTWVQGGWDFMKKIGLATGRYRDGKPVAVCGDLGQAAFVEILEDFGAMQISPTANTRFGLQLKGFIFPDGQTIDVATSATLSTDPAHRRSMLIMEPHNMRYRPVKGRDLQYVHKPAQRQSLQTDSDGGWIDGFKEGWFSHFTIEVDNVDSWAWITNLGATNGV